MKTTTGILLIVLVLAAAVATSCSLFDNPPTTDECSSLEGSAKDDCYFEVQKCSKIESLSLRDSCVAELAKIKEDIKVCDLIQSAKTKAFCMEQLAVLKKDSAICKTIEDTYWADNCHFSFAISDHVETFCTLINDAEQKNSCYKKIALATNKFQLCDYLQGVDREGCIVAIAKAIEDVKLCDRISDAFNRDVCKYRVAKESQNQSFCAEIQFKDVKQTCNELFADN